MASSLLLLEALLLYSDIVLLSNLEQNEVEVLLHRRDSVAKVGRSFAGGRPELIVQGMGSGCEDLQKRETATSSIWP